MPVVVHLSDIHFGAHRPDLAESVLADVASVGPDLVVVSGDLTQRARRGQFEQAQAFIDRLPAPVLTVIGNHDLPLINLPRRFLSGTRHYQRYITRDPAPIVTLPNLVAVGLDTMPTWRWKGGHVSSRQAAIVRQALGTAPQGAWRWWSPIIRSYRPTWPDSSGVTCSPPPVPKPRWPSCCPVTPTLHRPMSSISRRRASVARPSPSSAVRPSAGGPEGRQTRTV